MTRRQFRNIRWNLSEFFTFGELAEALCLSNPSFEGRTMTHSQLATQCAVEAVQMGRFGDSVLIGELAVPFNRRWTASEMGY